MENIDICRNLITQSKLKNKTQTQSRVLSGYKNNFFNKMDSEDFHRVTQLWYTDWK